MTEAVAGGQALATRLSQKGHNTKTASDVAQLATAGNAEARSEVRTAAQHIGEVLAAIVSFANPSVIVIGGSLAQLDEALLAGIRSGIYNRALPLATRKLPIEASALKEKAGTIGAITLAQQDILSETGVAALLGPAPRRFGDPPGHRRRK